MTRLLRISDLVVVGLLASGATACKEDNAAKESERAAERLNDVTEEMRQEVGKLDETARDKAGDLAERLREASEELGDQVAKTANEAGGAIGEVAEKSKDLSELAAQVEPAAADFERKRAERVDTLRAVHSVSIAQPLLINTLAKTVEHSQSEEARLVERLSVFEVRVEETGQLIEQLGHVEARDWEARNDAIGEAMSRLESARKEAWETLDSIARANGRTSMK
jgi:chromosome segregation ATPase